MNIYARNAYVHIYKNVICPHTSSIDKYKAAGISSLSIGNIMRRDRGRDYYIWCEDTGIGQIHRSERKLRKRYLRNTEAPRAADPHL